MSCAPASPNSCDVHDRSYVPSGAERLIGVVYVPALTLKVIAFAVTALLQSGSETCGVENEAPASADVKRTVSFIGQLTRAPVSSTACTCVCRQYAGPLS